MRRIWMVTLLVLVDLSVGCGGKSTTTQVNKGVQLFDAADYDGAQGYYEDMLVKAPEDPVATYYLGRVAIAREDHDDALGHLKRAVELAPDSASYHYWLAVAYANKVNTTQNFMEKGQLAPLMKSSAEKAIELDPDNLEARAFLAQYMFNAPPIVGGDVAKGWEQVEAIKARDPKRGHLLAARIHTEKKERDKAKVELDALLELDPDNPDVHYQVGIFSQGAEDWENAYASFEKALELDEKHMASLYQMGRTGVFSKLNLERAIECLEKYLETEPAAKQPTWAHAHWRLGMIYAIQERTDRARAEYVRALELDPDNASIKEALEELE